MNVSKSKYGFSGKWSPEIERYGFTQVPNLLIACQGHLGLKDGELVTLLQLLTFWFRHEGQVYPSITTLARFSAKGRSTVQKRLRELEKKGFVRRRQRAGTSNTYDLSPCVAQLYKHQKVCAQPLHRRTAPGRVKVTHQPASFPTYKEDEAKRRNREENSVRVILSQKYGQPS